MGRYALQTYHPSGVENLAYHSEVDAYALGLANQGWDRRVLYQHTADDEKMEATWKVDSIWLI